VVNKTVAATAQFENYILLHAYSRITAAPSCVGTQWRSKEGGHVPWGASSHFLQSFKNVF